MLTGCQEVVLTNSGSANLGPWPQFCGQCENGYCMEQPFEIHIEQQVLDDLKSKIRSARWPDAANGRGWQYGINLSYLQELAAYWANDFDWRKTEEAVNAYPQFVMDIDGYQVHYLHIKGKSGDNTPLIITHGWPGSFLGMLKIIPLLTEGDGPLFDLVIPSLPGFGYSGKPASAGINTAFIAGLWVKLMDRLGYSRFMAQGGDFGAIVSTRIALKYPEKISGLHLNYIPFNYHPFLSNGEELTREETGALQAAEKFFRAEGAYAQIQATKPLTLAYGLNDSPVGLCAWILQVFKSFSDPELTLQKLFSQDELLSNVTLYWVTGTIYSSMQLYRETMTEPLDFGPNDFVQTPTGIAHYPYPANFPARKFVERGFNVCYWNDMPIGGHFAALEQPELFAGDLKAFVSKL